VLLLHALWPLCIAMNWTPLLGSIRSQGSRSIIAPILRTQYQPVQSRWLTTTGSVGKSKKSLASEPPPSTPGDVPVINTKGKGAKGASKNNRGTRSKRGNVEEAEMQQDDEDNSGGKYATSTENQELPGERFDEGSLKSNTERAVKRCKDTVGQKVAGFGRADPGM
jgi:hypothetical protein